MGEDELKKRAIWQDESGKKAKTAETLFYEVFKEHFLNSDFDIIKHPKELNQIYLDVKLNEKTIKEIYAPDKVITKHGISPDFSITNKKSKKTLYIEVKRQDGWVEGKTRNDGRGNAHERLCKYFTPGLLNILRKSGKIKKSHLPLWGVFVGNITRDPLRVREITCWFDEYIDHVFFWRNINDKEVLINHFEKKLKPILE